MLAVDRADFVHKMPYEDAPQSISRDSTISAPHMHACALKLVHDYYSYASKSPRVLDVGSGSGYLTVALAILLPTATVIGVEKDQNLVGIAEINTRRHHSKLLDSKKVSFLHGDGRDGSLDLGQFDVIHVGADCGSKPPETLLFKLAPEGILIGPIGGEICVYFRKKEGKSFKVRRTGFFVRFVPLQ